MLSSIVSVSILIWAITFPCQWDQNEGVKQLKLLLAYKLIIKSAWKARYCVDISQTRD